VSSTPSRDTAKRHGKRDDTTRLITPKANATTGTPVTTSVSATTTSIHGTTRRNELCPS
jgi:hypothetical protein